MIIDMTLSIILALYLIASSNILRACHAGIEADPPSSMITCHAYHVHFSLVEDNLIFVCVSYYMMMICITRLSAPTDFAMYHVCACLHVALEVKSLV